MKSILFSVLCIAAVFCCSSSSAQTKGRYSVAGIEEDSLVVQFVARLQAAFAKDDRATVLSMIRYPLLVNFPEKRVKLNRGRVKTNFDKVFTLKVRSAIAVARPDSLFVNYQGIRIGDGELWIAAFRTPRDIKIRTVNNY